MKILMRKLHRWLGLLMAIQIIAWMASGFYFSLFPIEEIRGEHLTRQPEPVSPEMMDQLASPERVRETLDLELGSDWTLLGLNPVHYDGGAVWQVEVKVADSTFSRLLNRSGTQFLPPLSAEQAGRAASHLLRETVESVSVERVESSEPGGEFRGRSLPVWKVRFDEPESVNLYLDPWTGELLARRTDRWRLFDFFWMLHIMDFEDRDDFNHPLLQVAAFLGLIIAVSGVLLWILTTRVLRRKSRLA